MEKQNLMKSFLYPLGFLLLTAFLAASIAYPVYIAISGHYSVEKITHELTLLILITAIYPLSKRLRYNRENLGLKESIPSSSGKLLAGFLIGLSILGVVLIAELYLGIRVIDKEVNFTPTDISQLLFKALFIGLLISLYEELLFRGFLFHFIKSQSTIGIAIFLSALFFAALHFFNSGLSQNSEEVTGLTAFKIVVFSFSNLSNPEIFDSLLSLFFVGLLLAIVRSQTGSITAGIGLHSSWIFLIKTSDAFTLPDNESEWSFLAGSYDGTIGHLATGWLAIVILLYFAYTKKTEQLQQAAKKSSS